jgi:hypothetical protein
MKETGKLHHKLIDLHVLKKAASQVAYPKTVIKIMTAGLFFKNGADIFRGLLDQQFLIVHMIHPL